MKTALLQMDVEWASVQANIARAERLMDEAGEAQLYVLPEMWATGFAVEPEGIAEDEASSAALEWMQRQARERACAVCGSLSVRTDTGLFCNRHYFATQNSLNYYDKRHLFSHGGEQLHYQAGTSTTIVEHEGLRFLLLTCYDLRFPVWSRYGRAGEYDAIVLVANWPGSRQDAWEVLVRARAMENQCYVLAVNRVGHDGVCQYDGGSMVVDPLGRVVARCAEKSAEQPLLVELSTELLLKARSRFQVLADRDQTLFYPMV